VPRELRYRPKVRRLLDELIGQPAGQVTKYDTATLADLLGTTRQTVNAWIRADVDDPTLWFRRPDPNIEYAWHQLFAELLGREVEVIERIFVEKDEHTPDPNFQETLYAAVAAA
jgi:hypothetical protein